MCSGVTDIHCAAGSHLDPRADTHKQPVHVHHENQLNASHVCCTPRPVRPVGQTALCAWPFPQRHGAYWLIKAHHLNCGWWLQSRGAGARRDNDAQLSQHILWPVWHSEQQSRQPAHQSRPKHLLPNTMGICVHTQEPASLEPLRSSVSGFLLQVQTGWTG